MDPLITNDAIVLGILITILGAVFITAHSDALMRVVALDLGE